LKRITVSKASFDYSLNDFPTRETHYEKPWCFRSKTNNWTNYLLLLQTMIIYHAPIDSYQ